MDIGLQGPIHKGLVQVRNGKFALFPRQAIDQHNV